VRAISADKCASRERIADADVPIEVRERNNPHWISVGTFDNDRQPQAELAQPDGHGTVVNTKNRSAEHAATQLTERPALAVFGSQNRQSFQRMHQECS
jgi:hypothetical protein